MFKIFLTPLLVFSSIAFAETPEQASIGNITFNGPGCSLGQTNATLSPDFKELSLLFDSYVNEIGQGTSQPNSTTSELACRITFEVYSPSGWQYAFKSVDYRGFAALPASAQAMHRISTQTQNQPIASLREAVIKGQFNNNYYVHTESRPERYAWSDCSEGVSKVMLYSQLMIQFLPRTTDRSSAMISLDSADGSIRQGVGMEWRRCTVGRPADPGRPTDPGRGRGGLIASPRR